MTDSFENKMILYRPVGLQEVALIYDSGMKTFPARLPQQPIFYPVLQLEYARQTASGWNAKNGQLAGYVTEFKVEDKYIGKFETHAVGKSQHQELWIPAEEMEEFNKHILGHIRVLEAHFGNAFEGFVPEQFGLKGKNAVEQFTQLANSYLYKSLDFYLEIKRNHKAVFLNYPFWQTYEFKNPGLKEKILQAIREAWLTSFPKIPLPPPPVKQTHAPAQRLVDPDEEEITLVEETDSDSWADPVDEETTLEEETDSWADPVDDEIRPVKQISARAFVKPVDKELTPEDENDEDTFPDLEDEEILPLEKPTPPVWVTPIGEKMAPEKQIPVQPVLDSVDEEITAEDETDSDAQHWADLPDEESESPEQSNSDSLGDLIEEESTPGAQTASPFLVPPVHQEIRTAARTDSRAWGNPVHRESVHPEQTVSGIAQGIKLGLSEQYREAVEELSKALQEEPDNVVALISLGVAFQRLGEDDRALACYEAALKLDPRHAEAHYFRANILYARGDTREAIAGYTIAVGLKPELIVAHESPAPQDRLTDYSPAPAEMYRIARPAHRILDLNKTLETNPRQASRLKERAAAYYLLWNYEQAIADYSASLALQPDDASALHSRGVAYEQTGQYDRALEDYQRAVSINPLLSDVYIQRGVTFGKEGNLRQAIASLTEGIRLAPQNPDGYFNRGTAYFQQGDLVNAIDDFSNVIRLAPRDEAAYYWRGISNEEAGRRNEAIADYRQFLGISQDPQARAEIQQRLSQWNEGKRNMVSGRSTRPDDSQKPRPLDSKKPDQDLDLYALIAALGDRALNSTWLGSGVDCYGEAAEELFSYTDQDRPIQGNDLLRITSGIRQTMQGDFTAFDPGSTSHWILIRAWNGNGFYIEINDPKGKERLRTHFPSIEEVEGAYPPYEGLFVSIKSD